MKIKVSELKKIIKEEALKLYKKSILKSEKIEIEKQLSVLEEKTVNPWAVCHASTGPKKDAKFEKCVKDVKNKQGMDETSVFKENEVKKYSFSIKHDGGKTNITTTASSEEAAIKKIMDAEGCPRNAITKK